MVHTVEMDREPDFAHKIMFKINYLFFVFKKVSNRFIH